MSTLKKLTKFNIVIAIVFAMMLQLIVPIVTGLVFAEDTVDGLMGGVELYSGDDGGTVIDDVYADDPVKFTDVRLTFKGKDGNKLDDTKPIPLDARVEMKFEFEIEDIDDPEDKKDPGYVDTSKIYTIKIPLEITMSSTIGSVIDIYHETENVKIGEATINDKGTISVQFLDIVNLYDANRTGWFRAEGDLDLSKLGNGGEHTIVFEGIADVKVNFEDRIEEVTITKEAKDSNYDAETNTIEWTIKAKPKTNPKGGKIQNLIISDQIGGGHSYLSHEIVNGHNATIKFSETDKSFTINEVEDGKDYILKIKTKLDISAFAPADEDKKKTFENTISGTFGEESDKKTNTSSTTVKVPVDFINKKGDYNGRTDKPTITWTININNNNLDMPNGTTLIDDITSGLKLKIDTIKIDDKAISEYENDVDNNSTETQLKLVFNDGLNKTATITFDTEITNIGDAYDPTKDGVYKNTAYLKWSEDGKEVSVDSTEIGVGVGRTVIEKFAKGYDANDNRYVKWEIRVNKDRLDLKDITVVDTLPKELEYVTNTPPTGWTVSPGSVEANKEQNITFYYAGETNETHIITITAKVREGYTDIYGANKDTTFTNKIKLTDIRIVGDGESTTKDETYKSEVIRKTGTGYDYDTRVASWEIVVNKNKMTITSAIITDVLDANNIFVKDSLTLQDGTLIRVDGEPSVGQYSVTNGTIKINLGTINTEKTIKYQTIIPEEKINSVFKDNGAKELSNSATLTGGNIKDGGQNVTAKNTIKNVLIGKKGQYTKGNDYIDWKVVINSNNQKLGNVTLTDELETELILDLSTVKLYKLEVDSKGDYKQGSEYSIIGEPIYVKTTYTNPGNKVTFNLGNVDRAYLLEFRTDINAEELNKEISNTISLSGVVSGESKDAISVNFDAASAGAGGSRTKGTLKIIKTNEYKLPMKEVEFELLDSNGNSFNSKIEGKTNNKGELLFENLDLITYTIRETGTPEGYIKADDIEVKVKKGFIENGIDPKNPVVEIENKLIRGNIKFTKYGKYLDRDKETLAGAEFMLYIAPYDKEDIPVATIDSNKDGIVEFKNIPYGDYIIIENKAPAGYLKSTIEIPVSITKDGTTVIPGISEVINTRINADIQVKKFGEGDNPIALSGAKFELVQGGNARYTSITAEDGTEIFSDVEYGTYILRESKAPEGYNLGIESRTVTVDKHKELQIFNFYNTKIRGDISLKKYGIDGEETYVLPGATFALYDSENKLIEEKISNSEGIVLFEGIEYGDYVVKEIDVPKGYVNAKFEKSVSVRENNVTVEVEPDGVYNTKIRGSLEILKVQKGTEKALKGAEFTLYTAEDKEVAKVTTGEDGLASFDNLEYGDYYFVETKAPSGYIQNKEKHDIEIREHKETVEVTFENSLIPDEDPEGRIRIIKKDSDTKDLLSGAKFNIVNSNGKVVDTLTTNSKGEALSKYLPVGRYTIEEVDAPKGYIIEDGSITQRVSNGVTAEVVIYNEKEEKPEKPVVPEIPTEPTEPTDPEKPVEPGKPTEPGKSGGTGDEFENLDGSNPEGAPKPGDEKPKPILPKTGYDMEIGFLMLGFVLLTMGLLLKLKKKA